MKIYLINILLSAILCGLLAGCANMRETSENTTENMGVAYTVSSDGTYTCDGVVYQYKLELTGKDRTAVTEATYMVLTNNKDLTFNKVSDALISSTAKVGEPEFVVLGIN